MDAWRVDIKGFSDKLYQNLAKNYSWRGILGNSAARQNQVAYAMSNW